MTLLQQEPRIGAQPDVARSRASALHVERRDIVFYNVSRQRVRIGVTVRNQGGTPSAPTIMKLQAAPLGVFLPWSDLETLVVPSIPAGGAIEVATEVAMPRTVPLGEFSDVPPRRLLTAIGAHDEGPRREDARRGDMLNSLASILGGAVGPRTPTGPLPADPLALLGRPNVHWAGNINVMLGTQAVERHAARSLRVYPGRTNLAIFVLGDRDDEYQFNLSGSGAAWDACLYDFTARSLMGDERSSNDGIPQSRWLKMNRPSLILFAVNPPAECQKGDIDVHVRQRSTAREAVVEFSLDPNASGPGCYAV